MRIEWGRALETGCRTIDLQHEELIGLINQLHDVSPDTLSQQGLDEMLQRLDAYVVFHFGTEEQLMNKSLGVNDHTDEHRLQHKFFVDQVESIRANRSDNFGCVAQDVANFLSDWLYQHILKTDRELALQLNRAELST